MNKQIINKFLVILLSLLLIFLAGCGGIKGFLVAPNPTIQETELYSETVYIRNCADFFNEKRESLLDRLPIVVKVTLTEKAISDDSGEAVEIPKALRTKLEAAIEEEYKNHLLDIQNKNAGVDLVVPAYSIRIFEVKWIQECVCSIVVFEMDNQTFTANFSYRVEYPTLTQTLQMACTA